MPSLGTYSFKLVNGQAVPDSPPPTSAAESARYKEQMQNQLAEARVVNQTLGSARAWSTQLDQSDSTSPTTNLQGDLNPNAGMVVINSESRGFDPYGQIDFLVADQKSSSVSANGNSLLSGVDSMHVDHTRGGMWVQEDKYEYSRGSDGSESLHCTSLAGPRNSGATTMEMKMVLSHGVLTVLDPIGPRISG